MSLTTLQASMQHRRQRQFMRIAAVILGAWALTVWLASTAFAAEPAAQAAAQAAAAAATVQPAANTYCVGPSGDFTTIQAAINAAQDGDTILIEKDTYAENLVITKTLTLDGRYEPDCSAKSAEGNGSTDIIPTSGRAVTIDPGRAGVAVTMIDIGAQGNATGLGGAAPVDTTAITLTPSFPYTPVVPAGAADWQAPQDWYTQLGQLAAASAIPDGQEVMARIDALHNPVAPAFSPAVAPARAATRKADAAVDCGGAIYVNSASIQLIRFASSRSIASETGAGYGGSLCVINPPADGVLIQDSQFVKNMASTTNTGIGGDVFIRGGEPGSVRIDDISFYYAVASNFGTGWGGALAVLDTPDLVLTGTNNCTIGFNVASNAGNGSGGGAMFLNTPRAQVEHCRFYSNYASGGGAGEDPDGIQASSGFGGGLYVEASDYITLTDNKFDFNVAQTGAPVQNRHAEGGGVFFFRGQAPTIVDNVFDRNVAGFSGQGYGGGLDLVWPSRIEGSTQHADIHGNEFTKNWANVINYIGSGGGGLYIYHMSNSQVMSNIFAGNVANLMGESGIQMPDSPILLGGAAMLEEVDAVEVSGNNFTGNVTTAGGFGLGGALGLRKCTATVIQNNTFIQNLADSATKGSGLGGALTLQLGRNLLVHNNLFAGNSGALATPAGDQYATSALALIGDDLYAPESHFINLNDVVIDGNLIDNSGQGLMTAAAPNNFGISVQGTNRFTITNNVLAGNTLGGIIAVYKYFADDQGTVFETRGAVNNNTFYANGKYGLWLLHRWSNQLALTNNIIVSHTLGVEGTDLYGPADPVTLDYSLFFSNTQDLGPTAGAAITSTHAVHANPRFVDPANALFYLMPTSPAINAGNPAGIPPAPPADIDNYPRPYGPRVDIGAYEWHGQGAILPLVSKH